MLGANGIFSDCVIGIGGDGRCFGAAFQPKPITKSECESLRESLGIVACYYGDDYWAGAAKECGGVQNMPTLVDLNKIASKLYVGEPDINIKESQGLTYKGAGTASAFGLPEPTFTLWSGQYVGHDSDGYAPRYVHYRCFLETSTFYSKTWDWDSHRRNNSTYWAVCAF